MFAALFGTVVRPTDEELARRSVEGDRQAFSELVRRYQARVYSLCLRWMGEPALAEEVAQDVFLSLYRALGSFRGDARLSTWIYRVAINHCKNKSLYHRRRARGRHEPLEGLGDEEDGPKRQVASDGPGSDSGMHQQEAEHLLEGALEALDDDHRQIILLRDVEDLSYEEIAEILSLPKGTVKSRLHRARHELARRLGKRVSSADVL